MEEDDRHQENGIHVAKDSDRQQRLRLCVLNEILNTERDYVRTLLFLQSVSLTFTPLTVAHVPPPAQMLPTWGCNSTPLHAAFPLLTDVTPMHRLLFNHKHVALID